MQRRRLSHSLYITLELTHLSPSQHLIMAGKGDSGMDAANL